MADKKSIIRLLSSGRDVLENSYEFVSLILPASRSENYAELEKKGVELFQNVFKASDNSFKLIDQLNKLRSDYNELLKKLKNADNLNSRTELIMDFINNNTYIINILFSYSQRESNKTPIEKYLDTLNFVKNKCDQHKQKALKKKILEKEAKFIKNNKEKIKKIYKKKLII